LIWIKVETRKQDIHIHESEFESSEAAMPIHLPRDLGEHYSPLYFLAALGAGGITVTFFLYLMFWVPHPGQPVPVFEDIMAAWTVGGTATKAMIATAWAGIAFFALMHFRLLAWNLRELAGFRRTAAYAALRKGNAETQLLAVPLALAMAINAGFILGMVFVPGLWPVVEWLFPVAILAFLVVGAFALRLLGDFFGRVFTSGGFDCAKNNSFAQLLPAFALVMTGVGLAAPAAMSTTALTAGVAYVGASFFLTAGLLLGAVQLVLGFRAMLENGADVAGAPTFWVAIPIVTVFAIAWMRLGHGLHEHFGAQEAVNQLPFLTNMLAVQLIFGLLGYVVLRRIGYFGRFVTGAEKSPAAYALVCPPVALSVMVQFYLNRALVPAGLVDKASIAYWTISALAIAMQLAAIWLAFRLNAKLLAAEPRPAAVPAE
jgi:hypothetical protein